MVLQDNGGDNLTVSVNGNFKFATAVAYGAAYGVTVFAQPVGYSCSVTGDSGTVTANVTNVTVSCVKLPPMCFAYVTYATSGNVAAYKIDATSGALASVGSVAAGSNPASISVTPSGKLAYVANSGTSVVGTGSVTAYKIDATLGTLTEVAGSPFVTGTNPSDITVDPSGKFVYVTNRVYYSIYTANQPGYVSAYAIDSTTGALTFVNSVATANGPSSVAIDPSGKFAYVANAVSANISAYKINATTGALMINGTIGPDLTPPPVSNTPGRIIVYQPDTNPHPSSITIDPSGKYVYMTDSNSLNLSTYTIDMTSGALNSTGIVTMLGASYSLSVNPSGKFAYAAIYSYYGFDYIAAFNIDATLGTLTTITGSPFKGDASNYAKALTVDPTGKFAYMTNITNVAGNYSSNVVAYTIDVNGGLNSVGVPLVAGGIAPSFITTTCTIK